jgi:hypothetical protein
MIRQYASFYGRFTWYCVVMEQYRTLDDNYSSDDYSLLCFTTYEPQCDAPTAIPDRRSVTSFQGSTSAKVPCSTFEAICWVGSEYSDYALHQTVDPLASFGPYKVLSLNDLELARESAHHI